ncbi:MAG TPA: hypothetical protein VIL71_00335 [Spirillospora sp.]
MIALRTLIPLLAASLIVAGCSGSDGSSSASQASATPAGSSSGPSASPSPTSPFCLNLSFFQAGLVAYRAEAGSLIHDEPVDFAELKRKAALIQQTGERMEPSVPPDIEKEFRTVLEAIKESASNLRRDAKVRDVIDPIYGDENRAAFEAMNKYECKPGS